MTDKKPDKDDAKHREEARKIIEEKPFDFIERTKPEDRVDDTEGNEPRRARGQLTRDNVNPAIPSAKQGEGPGIVDPKSLGMESQAGVAPPAVVKPDDKAAVNPTAMTHGAVGSVNEPLGSNGMPWLEEAATKQQPATAKPAAPARASGKDPDDLEDEIEAAEDDDDVDIKHGSKTGKKK